MSPRLLVGVFLVGLLLGVFDVDSFSTSQRRRQSDGRREQALSQALQIIYKESGTPGVLERSDGILEQYKATSLVKAAIDASQGNRGMASGILNAFLGAACSSCCESGGDGGDHAIRLMSAYDKLGASNFRPDLVALSLAYVATHQQGLSEQAQIYLQRAEQLYSMDGQQRQHQQGPTKSDVWSDLNQNHDIQVLQDHEEFVVLSKPSGMVCYHAPPPTAAATTASRNKKKKQSATKKDLSLETCLLDRGVPLSTLNAEGRGMVHRIDRGTSGCLVLAKTNSMHAKLLVQFFLKKKIQKSYQALVVVSPAQKKLPKKGSICLDIDGRPARSQYRIEHCFAPPALRIQVQTEQGRRHQVRKHCSQGLGAPILLDPLYGGTSALSQLNNIPAQKLCRKIKAQKKICLHANSLAIPDQGINVKAPLPEWWQELEHKLAIES